MNLKHMAAAKLLCSNWSSTKLDHLLEQTDIRMSRALDYVMPNNIKVSCVQLSLKAELPFKDCMELILANVNTAVADGTQLIVFPEYIGLLPILSSPSIFDLCYQFSEDLINQDREAVEEVLHFYAGISQDKALIGTLNCKRLYRRFLGIRCGESLADTDSIGSHKCFGEIIPAHRLQCRCTNQSLCARL